MESGNESQVTNLGSAEEAPLHDPTTRNGGPLVPPRSEKVMRLAAIYEELRRSSDRIGQTCEQCIRSVAGGNDVMPLLRGDLASALAHSRHAAKLTREFRQAYLTSANESQA